MKIIYAFILLLFFNACNSPEKQKEQESHLATDTSNQKLMEMDLSWTDKYLADPCRSSGGMGNFIISSDTALKMIDSFKRRYDIDISNSNRSIDAMQKNFWVDKRDIQFIDKFLTDNSPSYDGIRLHFAANPISDPTYTNTVYKNKTELYFFPTKPVDTVHKDNWAYMKPTGFSSEYILPYSSVSTKIGIFNTVYYTRNRANSTTQKSLTKSVWIAGCVWKYMSELIAKTPNMDGFDIALAAYLGTEYRFPKGADKLRKASTVIFIPTVPDDSTLHRRDFTIVDYIIKNKAFGALNHGELCPDNCPPPIKE